MRCVVEAEVIVWCSRYSHIRHNCAAVYKRLRISFGLLVPEISISLWSDCSCYVLICSF